MSILSLIGRDSTLFDADLLAHKSTIENSAVNSKFLVIGGAGTIGQSVTKEIFKLSPKLLHVVDISENNLVELVREIRSTIGYTKGEFKTFAIDCGSESFKYFFKTKGPYDYIFNLSALKHVRSERDEFTLMRMVEVNILNTLSTLKLAKDSGCKKYFCVSTDKAANPANMMGASKRIMEMFLMRESMNIDISMARFANVAFSDGSLLHGFNQRIQKKQPIAAPQDVKRYFITPSESGSLCILSGLLGENRDIFFPKLSKNLNLITFKEIAIRYLKQLGFEPLICSSEDEAREVVEKSIELKEWPCYFFESDTTGEKSFEEFYTDSEILDLAKFETVGIIKNQASYDDEKLDRFLKGVSDLKIKETWSKQDILSLFFELMPEFIETYQNVGKNLIERM